MKRDEIQGAINDLAKIRKWIIQESQLKEDDDERDDLFDMADIIFQICELLNNDLKSDSEKWHDAEFETPKDGEMVLCIKEVYDGDNCRLMYDFETYHSGNSINNGWFGYKKVLYWVRLPDMPEEYERICETE